MNSSFERHFYYWILPAVYISFLALIYYTGIPLLQNIIAPDLRRELGLLETTQHLLVLAVLWMAIRGWRGAQSPLERLGFTLAILLASFQFLEEINYGQHYLRALGLLPPELADVRWNVHNRGLSTPLKNVGDIVTALYFFIFPLIVTRRWPAWLQYLAPPRLLAVSVLCSVLVSKFIHYLSDNTLVEHNVFKYGASEFREAFIYYFVLIYVRELATHRRWPGFGAKPAGTAG